MRDEDRIREHIASLIARDEAETASLIRRFQRACWPGGPGDRRGFLVLLDLVMSRFRWSCLSYCLMGNHYHLLLEIDEANLSEGMQVLNGTYARGFNERHLRDGCVFGSRFWCSPVTTER